MGNPRKEYKFAVFLLCFGEASYEIRALQFECARGKVHALQEIPNEVWPLVTMLLEFGLQLPAPLLAAPNCRT